MKMSHGDQYCEETFPAFYMQEDGNICFTRTGLLPFYCNLQTGGCTEGKGRPAELLTERTGTSDDGSSSRYWQAMQSLLQLLLGLINCSSV